MVIAICMVKYCISCAVPRTHQHAVRTGTAEHETTPVSPRATAFCFIALDDSRLYIVVCRFDVCILYTLFAIPIGIAYTSYDDVFFYSVSRSRLCTANARVTLVRASGATIVTRTITPGKPRVTSVLHKIMHTFT